MSIEYTPYENSCCVRPGTYRVPTRIYGILAHISSQLNLTTFSYTMDYSADMNNLGAAAAEKGKLQLALQLLKEAVQAKVAHISDFSIRIAPNPKSQVNSSSESSFVHLEADSFALGETSAVNAAPINSRSSPSGAFLYKITFLIDSCKARVEGNTNRTTALHASPTYVIESASVLYNIGVIYHVKAGGRRNTVAMTKSIEMYKMALNLVKDVIDWNCCHLVDIRLVIAIINNLGEIYYEQGRYRLAEMHFLNLSAILISVSASGGNKRFDKNDWVGLVMNTKMLTKPKIAAAA
jgi:tetratricopeptide (TPR) repeat protein